MNKVGYKLTAIKDIGKVVTGKTPLTAKPEYYNGPYMFVSPNELHDGYMITSSEKTITKEGLQSIKTNSINGISILVGCIGWDMGNVAMCFDECATNQQINSITDIKDEYNPYYVYYWLATKKEYLFSIASVTRTPILSKGTFQDVLIPIPDKDIQDKIADVLLSIDNKIEVNNKINETLQEQASLLYDYWFTQFDFPDETGSPYKSSGGKMVWNEQLKREIPEGWIVKPVSELLNVVTGKEDANFSVIKGKYKFFTCSKDALLCNEFAFDGKAILIAGNGDFNVKHYSGKFNAYQRTYVLIPENEKYYGTIYLAAARLINMFKKGSNGSIVKFITKDDVDNIMITIPNNDTYFEVINHIITTIESKQRENEELSALRDWLLPMLMNGQVTVE